MERWLDRGCGMRVGLRHPWKRIRWVRLVGMLGRGSMSEVAGGLGVRSGTWVRSRRGDLFEVRMRRGGTEWRWHRPDGGD